MESKKYDKKFCLGMKVKKHPELIRLNEENLKIKQDIRELKKIDCNIVKIVLLGISSILMFIFCAMFIFLNSYKIKFIDSFGLISIDFLMSIAFVFSCLCFYYFRKIENKEKEFLNSECDSIYDD